MHYFDMIHNVHAEDKGSLMLSWFISPRLGPTHKKKYICMHWVAPCPSSLHLGNHVRPFLHCSVCNTGAGLA